MLKVDNLVDNVAGFLENKIELTKIEAREAAAKVMVKALLLSIIVLLAIFTLCFASLAVAFVINTALDSKYLGFLVITGFYLLLLIGAIMINNNENVFLKLEERAAEIFNNHKKENKNGKNPE